MGSLLHDAAGINHIDAVGMEHRGKTMGDDEARAPDHQIVERRLHDLFALRIKCGGRLVEDEDARILQDGACDGNALALTARDTDAALPICVS